MTNLPHSTRRWPKIVMAVTVLIELVLGIGVAALQGLDSATPISVDAALDDFRDQQQAASETTTPATDDPSPVAEVDPTAPARAAETTTATATPSARASAASSPDTSTTSAPGPTRPAPGVYTYATSGWETIDTSIADTRHDYPAETTITVIDEGSRQRGRWNALKERWDEWTTATTAAGEEWLTLDTYHEFFGQKDQRSFQCQAGSLFIPSDRTPGTTFEMHCGNEGAHSTCAAQVIGLEPIDVGGVAVETLRLRMDTTMDGAIRGHMGRDYWVLPSTGLLVREILKTDTESNGPAGAMRYREEVELTLKSLNPAQ